MRSYAAFEDSRPSNTQADDHRESLVSVFRRLLLEEVDARIIPTRLRDGVARLFAPYL